MTHEKTIGQTLYELHIKSSGLSPRRYTWEGLHPGSRQGWERFALAAQALFTGEPAMEVVAVLRPKKNP